MPQLDIPLQDQRHGQVRHRRHGARHALRQAGRAAGALRRDGEVGRRLGGEEGEGLRQGGHPRRQDRHDVGLGGGGGHDLSPAAKKAAEALKITYDNGPNAKVSDQTLIDEAKRLQQAEDSGQLFVKNGDPATAIAGAAKMLEAEYLTCINIHAPLEPMNATAYEKDGIWHIHTGNQFASRTGGIAAGALGIDPKNVVLHQYFIGGGFGRRLDGDMVVPAVLASKAVGKPVKLIYAREDDMAMDFTRPLTYQKVKAGLDGDGKLVGAGARRRLRLADRALGHPGVPDALGRQEGPARQLHGERCGLLVHRAQPSGARHPERAGAEGDAVRASCARWRRVGPSGRSKA